LGISPIEILGISPIEIWAFRPLIGRYTLNRCGGGNALSDQDLVIARMSDLLAAAGEGEGAPRSCGASP
jgi:hypothetical protein